MVKSPSGKKPPSARQQADARSRPASARLRDVAEHAGVHISTASRALDPLKEKRISADVAAKVKASARALGYQGNVIAASLRRRRSHTVGVIVPDLTNPMFPPMFRGIEDRLQQIGYSALLTNSDFNLEREWQLLDMFVKRQVDGLILATARLDDPIVAAARERGMTVVLMNRATAGATVPAILADEAAGIGEAFSHLHALGHRHIAHIAGPQDVSTGRARKEAFVAAAKRHGLEAGPRHVVVASQFNEAAGHRAALHLLQSGLAPTAIVAANDALALGVYDALSELNLACPTDVSVTGFNDMPFVDRLKPALTSVRIPQYRMGYEAADELAARFDDDTRPVAHRVLPPKLIIRDSTGPVRQSA